MNYLKLNVDKIYDFVDRKTIESMQENVLKASIALENKTGEGNDFLGWTDLPNEVSDSQLSEIESVASKIRENIDVLIVIGIGGSYLGTKAVAEALTDTFSHLKDTGKNPPVIFAGQNIGEDYLVELMELLDKKRYGIVVISKSGTTTEPAIAFRLLKAHLESKVGVDKAKELIVAVTDSKKGALRTMADKNGIKSFIIPDDVGGRYSVLTPVGLVPLAIGGFDIRALVKGAVDIKEVCTSATKFEDNPAAIYAAARIALYNSGKKIEILANFDNKLHYFAEWWKQLFGESDGKDGKGIYPSSVDFTADLHSMGQYIQEGERILFETVISIANAKYECTIPSGDDDSDGLNYLAGKRIDYVNKMAELGTQLAHVDGGVPNIRIEVPELNEYYIGQLMYFFEKACGIGGYLMGINPFNQPGVEAYKKNMFALLEKPGFEDETKNIKEKL